MSAPGGRFEGRVAIVTGASRGIGLAVAERLVREGARVVVTARKPEPLQEAAASLGGESVALAVAGHAADPDHQRQAVETALAAFGRLDVLVNNTGINPVAGALTDAP
jgi:NAD(P)-dependent dehydrogenase (short-subunit alcohol dehydrogenase family)